jgi:hypothetical protein
VLTFTGVLQYYANGKWNDYSGQDLELNVEYKNKWYYWTKTIKTGSKGEFSYQLDAPWTATWNRKDQAAGAENTPLTTQCSRRLRAC